jgi:hypothetical protein
VQHGGIEAPFYGIPLKVSNIACDGALFSLIGVFEPMRHGQAFIQLGEFLENIEGQGLRPANVELRDSMTGPPDRIKIGIELRASLFTDDQDVLSVDMQSASIRSDGTLSADIDVSIPVEESSTEISAESEESPNSANKGARTNGARTNGHDVKGSETPYYKDRELLCRVYETNNTFREMVEDLGLDVTPETVRQHMINNGIHTPNSNDRNGHRSDLRATDQTIRTNGVPNGDTQGKDSKSDRQVDDYLPEHVDAAKFVETVQSAKTLYEVEQELEMDRNEAHELLVELNLLECVMGRLSSQTNQNFTADEIEDRMGVVLSTQ